MLDGYIIYYVFGRASVERNDIDGAEILSVRSLLRVREKIFFLKIQNKKQVAYLFLNVTCDRYFFRDAPPTFPFSIIVARTND